MDSMDTDHLPGARLFAPGSGPGWPDRSPPFVLLTLSIVLLTSLGLAALSLSTHLSSRPPRKRAVTVLVLGDIGRSPRMMYHAASFARHGWETALVGYTDTPPVPALLEVPHVHIRGIANLPRALGALPWVVRAPLRVLLQVYSVLKICLFDIPVATELFLVQNPPSIPTLWLAQLICRLSGSKLIIDWHNTGYSILAMRTGEQSILVKIAEWWERTFGQEAHAHLFVTNALKDFLVDEWDLKGRKIVLHDRPPANFRRTEPIEAHELFHRLLSTFEPPLPSSFLPSDSAAHTPLTRMERNGLPKLSDDRPAVVVSSTSWTADEDFSLLLRALDVYQKAKSANPSLPRLLVLITGRGAYRPAFERAVAMREADGKQKRWTDIVCRCLFLPARDYPLLLGCADLGVSLHTSSSGRDLPMKVVDMFGCGLPVCAKNFACLGELVVDGKNGRVFETGDELGAQMISLLTSFPDAPALQALRAYFDPPAGPRQTQRGHRRRPSTVVGNPDPDWCAWDENWDRALYTPMLSTTARLTVPGPGQGGGSVSHGGVDGHGGTVGAGQVYAPKRGQAAALGLGLGLGLKGTKLE